MVTSSFPKSSVFKMFSVHKKTKSRPPAQRGCFQGPLAAKTKTFSLFQEKVNREMFVFYLQDNFPIKQTAFLYEQTGNIQILSSKGLHSSKRVFFLCRLAFLTGLYAEN